MDTKTTERAPAPSRLALIEQFFKDRFDLRYNLIKNEPEMKKLSDGNWEAINENTLYRMLHHHRTKATIQDIQILLGSDFVKQYNPIAAYFNRVQPLWNEEQDGDSVNYLAGFLNIKDPERFKTNFKKWLVRCVVCALVPAYYNKSAIILVGPKQDIGKSSWCRFLCPRELSDYMTENISIDKDSLIAICNNFLINMDELATQTKMEINSLKSIFSKDRVKIRLPYGRRALTMPRIASFIGSTNKQEFLTDETGSVRFLNFEIEGIDWSYQEKVNIDLIWSQAYQLWQSGYKYELTKEEIAINEAANKVFSVATTEIELISKYYSPGSKDDHDKFYQPTDILLDLLEKVNGRIKLSPVNIGRALTMLGFIQEQKKNHHNRSYPVKGYYIKCE